MLKNTQVAYDVILLLLYCGLIYCLSDQSALPTAVLFLHQDKAIHALAYAVMAWLVWRNILHTDRSVLFFGMFSIGFCSLYGMSDEWHQSFVPNRDADIWDWVADTTGAVLTIMWLMRSKQEKSSTS